MLVQTMSWDEIYRELTDDFTEVNHKMMLKLKVAMQAMVRKRQTQISEVFHLSTKKKNEWDVAVAFSTTRQIANFYLKSFDKIGVIAFSVYEFDGDFGSEPYLVKFNTHFLKRYKERMHLEEIV